MLSIIDAIDDGTIIGNIIRYNNQELSEIYRHNYIHLLNDGASVFRANTPVTPYYYPFFHLNAEPYYHIKWKDGVTPPRQAITPSNRYLLTNVEYAYLDNELWELLQDPAIRREFKEQIINHYLKEQNNKPS
jgi:putative restriction endonuclease